MAKIVILANSKAGKRKQSVESLGEMVRELGIDAELVGTESPRHMCETIRSLQREGVERIAIAGGDGTLHEAIQCFAGTPSVLGIVPLGTQNNFAHALGLPMEIDKALAILADGEVRQVDLGKTNGIYFSEAAGVGLFADILDDYGGSNKNVMRALYAIAKTFFTLRAKRLRLTLDGEVVSERAVMCTVANTYRLGLGAPLAPGASIADGLLDVVILGDLTRFELIRYYRALQTTGRPDPAKISRMQAKHVKIETSRPLSLHVDDKVAGKTPVNIEVIAGGLRVIAR